MKYQYISTIDYSKLETIFDDYNEEELQALYDRYNGTNLLQKTIDEVTEFDIQEFLILQNQLKGIYQKDSEEFSDEKIKLELFTILEKNVKHEGKQVC